MPKLKVGDRVLVKDNYPVESDEAKEFGSPVGKELEIAEVTDGFVICPFNGHNFYFMPAEVVLA